MAHHRDGPAAAIDFGRNLIPLGNRVGAVGQPQQLSGRVNGTPLVEAEVKSDPGPIGGVGVGAVQAVAVAHGHVARVGDKRQGAWHSLAVLGDDLRDVEVSPAVAPRQHPHGILRGAAVQLRHIIEAVLGFLPVRLPVRRAVCATGPVF